MASLQHLGGRSWRVRVHIDGKVRSRSFTANGKRQAALKASGVEALLRAEQVKAASTGTVAELAEEWLTIGCRDLSPTTLRSYRLHAARITDTFGTVPVDQLTAATVDRWLHQQADTRSPATAHHSFRVLRAMLRWGHRRRNLPPPVTEMVTVPNHRSPEVSPPSSEVVRELLESIPAGMEWGRAVRLSAFTGLRRGEIVGLQWGDLAGGRLQVQRAVIEDGPGVVVKEPKGRRSRWVAIGADAQAVLEEQGRMHEGRYGKLVAAAGGADKFGIQGVREVDTRIQMADSPWVFTNWATMGPRRPGWLSLMWGRHRGDHRVRLHDLRHWYATTALAAGVPLADVSAQLGHAKPSTTSDIYSHATEQARAHVPLAVEAALRGA